IDEDGSSITKLATSYRRVGACGRAACFQIPVKRLCLQDPPPPPPISGSPATPPSFRHRREVTSVTLPLKTSQGRRASQCPGVTRPAPRPGGLRARPRCARCPGPPLRAPAFSSASCYRVLAHPGHSRPCPPLPAPSHPGRGRGPLPCPQASVLRGVGQAALVQRKGSIAPLVPFQRRPRGGLRAAARRGPPGRDFQASRGRQVAAGTLGAVVPPPCRGRPLGPGAGKCRGRPLGRGRGGGGAGAGLGGPGAGPGPGRGGAGGGPTPSEPRPPPPGGARSARRPRSGPGVARGAGSRAPHTPRGLAGPGGRGGRRGGRCAGAGPGAGGRPCGVAGRTPARSQVPQDTESGKSSPGRGRASSPLPPRPPSRLLRSLPSSAWFKMGSQVSVDMGAVRVVIVGGGFGGIAAASQLQTLNIPFMLVDMKDSFHHNVAALRASVESGFAKKTFISYSVTFKENFRQGLVVEIDVQNQMVLLEDGEALPFSHLILATGSTGLFPGKFNQVSSWELAIQAYEDMVKQVQRSQSVVVVGGGSAGVEMAAEVKTEFPEKEVTLIHSQVALADKELLPCVRQEAKEILLQKGVQLLLSERVSNLEDLPLNEYRERIQVHTDKGTEVATNLVIVCNGIKVNSSAYHSAFDGHLASNGALRVNEYLQVEGYSHIYAIGDCADVKEPKMAYHAGLHASVAVANIVNSRKQRPLKAYKPGALTFLLAMGRNDGVGQISGFYVGRLMVRLAKSRDLFVSSSWKTMRQSPP
uniref:Ferroptosis suppressor protein 1 n=3 Tax=Canis lupus TaxID=9612 RepID=A0A8C0NDS2_CANLF